MTIEPYHDEPVTEALLDIEASSPERPPPAAIVVDERPSNEENRLPRVWRRRSSIAGIGHHRHESPSSHQHRAAPRLEQRQHIPVLYVPEALPEEPNGHEQTGKSTSDQDVSQKTRIIGILVCTIVGSKYDAIHRTDGKIGPPIRDYGTFCSNWTYIIYHRGR